MTKFTTDAAPATDHERELLTILMEECAEVQQRASKAIRFGPREVQPGQPLDNMQRLETELGDVYAMINMLCEAGLIDYRQVSDAAHRKMAKLPNWLLTA